ncbi:KamA family radical SAM protein [Candidatus Rariloculus sp.]|uniref:KamA family radical SAM protein n=1 Tax=Candidatus Rariloculus sp. TaxID=3101265 RepID=UPI003D0FB1E6
MSRSVSTVQIARPAPRERFQAYTQQHLSALPQLAALSPEKRFEIEVVANVLPFRTNRYVAEQLIDWNRVPDDPIFRLVFPQREMLDPEDYAAMAGLLRKRSSRAEIAALANSIRAKLNPHPADQEQLNTAKLDGRTLEGVQHKYDETVLFFPARGQVCHSYCTFCFRWAQFIGDRSLKFASSRPDLLARYLRGQPRVSDLLITGGDPMVMLAHHLESYIEPLITPELEQIQTIRIGTKSLTFWPQRYVSDPDASELLRVLERWVRAGKHVAIMAHYNHWRELETPIAREAIRRIRETGAVIRSQGPLLRHINDDGDVWGRLWQEQVRLGIVPYYMFVERDTGAREYFEVPLARGWEIYRHAMKQVSGLGRTARGPSMSTSPGKIEIQGVSEIGGEKVFVLRFIQGRRKDWVQRPFFARYDERATWLDQLEPALGASEFFFEPEFRRMTS